MGLIERSSPKKAEYPLSMGGDYAAFVNQGPDVLHIATVHLNRGDLNSSLLPGKDKLKDLGRLAYEAESSILSPRVIVCNSPANLRLAEEGLIADGYVIAHQSPDRLFRGRQTPIVLGLENWIQALADPDRISVNLLGRELSPRGILAEVRAGGDMGKRIAEAVVNISRRSGVSITDLFDRYVSKSQTRA